MSDTQLVAWMREHIMADPEVSDRDLLASGQAVCGRFLRRRARRAVLAAARAPLTVDEVLAARPGPTQAS